MVDAGYATSFDNVKSQSTLVDFKARNRRDYLAFSNGRLFEDKVFATNPLMCGVRRMPRHNERAITDNLDLLAMSMSAKQQ